MDKSRAIELLKLAVPIKALTQQEYADFVEAVNMGMDALKAQLSKEGTTSELISRQDALDIFDDYNVSVENGELEAYSRDRKRLCDLPPIQPEPTDINAKEAVYNLAEKIGIHQLFALTVELRGEPIQPEPQWIPVERGFPEDYTDVLVWFEYFRYGDYNCLYQTHGIGTYVANYNSWTINHESGWKDLRVIAWMPLPKPFEGGIK